YKILTSFFTLAEVRRVRGSQERLQQDELENINQMFADFLEHEWIEPIELGRSVAEKAQTLGAIYGINPGDAVHLPSAIMGGAKMLLAWDRGWLNRIPEGICEGVRILEPFWTGALPL